MSRATDRSVARRWVWSAAREPSEPDSQSEVSARSRWRSSAACMPIAPVDRLSWVWDRSSSPSENMRIVVTPHSPARATEGTRASMISERRMEPRRRRAPVRGDIVVLERSGGGEGTHGGRQRVPAAAKPATESASAFVTNAGPVRTGAAPPLTLPLIRYSHSASTAR